MSEIVPDHIHAGAFVVRSGVTEQSWIDLEDPTRIEFEYVQRIVEALQATPAAVDFLITGLGVSRNLERVADHATNIAEDVIYMITGRIHRHGRRRALQ